MTIESSARQQDEKPGHAANDAAARLSEMVVAHEHV